MATIKPFSIFDILDFNAINLDILTETVSPLATSSTSASMGSTSRSGRNFASQLRTTSGDSKAIV